MNIYALNLSVFITHYAVFISLNASCEKDPNGGVDKQLILQLREICNIVRHIVGMFAHNDCLPS